MKAFVTGGSGFVGRHLIAALAARGYAVRALARSDASAGTVRQAGAEPVPGSLDNGEALFRGVSGCDAVFHAAARIAFWKQEQELGQTNVQGTRTLLAAAKAAGVRRFIHISAAAVLSTGGAIVDADETQPIPQEPFGAYVRTKALAEQLVLAANTPDFTTIAVRPHTVWGPGDRLLLPAMVQFVRDGMFVWVDHGRYPYATCHVRNLCEGALLAAEKGQGGHAYFLTDGPPIEFRAFIAGLLRTQGIAEPGSRSVSRRIAGGMAFLAESVWRMLGLRSKPLLTRAELALTGFPITVRDAKARRELGYQGLVLREAGLAELAKTGGGGGA